MKKLLLLTLLSSSLLFSEWIQGTLSHVVVRHREPEGIGSMRWATRRSRASSLLTGSAIFSHLSIFGHMFNDGRAATNIGLGGRFAPGDNWVFGLNSY